MTSTQRSEAEKKQSQPQTQSSDNQRYFNPESPIKVTGRRSRSLNQSQVYTQLLKTQINDLIDQKVPNYQHMELSCVCPSCLCGRCICKVKPQPKMYPRDLRSMYQQEFPWKQGDQDNTKQSMQFESFKMEPQSLNKDSLYRQDYQAFKVQNLPKQQVEPNTQPQQQQKVYIKDQQPFYSITQYNRDYLPFGAVQSMAMKPFDQLSNLNSSELPHMLDTTYRNDYKKFQQPSSDGEFENGKYKLHTNPHQPNMYMNTTYQAQYQRKFGQKPQKLQVGQSNMPFGYGNNLNVKTVYRDHYVPMRARKCPARVVLEEICDHSIHHGLNLSLPAISQIQSKAS